MLVDMHIPDWNPAFLQEFSPENYAEMMALAGVDTAEIYAGSCLGLCNWPTQTGYRHANTADRDILGQTVAACRKKGLNVVIYLNVWNRKAYEEHPEWRIVRLGNRDTWRMGICCPNTPYREFFLNLLDELNRGYDCDGLWIDMIGWFHDVCYCPDCRRRFRSETGYSELPEQIDWDDPVWNTFQSCRMRWMEEFARDIRTQIKTVTPQRSLTLQCSSLLAGWFGGLNMGFLQQIDYLAADCYGDYYEQSAICKLFRALSVHRPIEFMVSRCEKLTFHTTSRSQEDLETRGYASLANQAAFTLIDAIDPSGGLNRKFYDRVSELNRNLRHYADRILPDAEPWADVAIYFSPESMMKIDGKTAAVKDSRATITEFNPLINLVRILVERHLTFTFASSRDLDDLLRYPVLILSDCSHLADDECEAIRQYVAEGGRLYASGPTSLYDSTLGRLSDFRLADLFGCHAGNGFSEPLTYLEPVEHILPLEAPVQLSRPQVMLEPGTGTTLATLTRAICQTEETVHFGSVLSNPPGEKMSAPALIHNRFGKGEVLYCGGVIEEERFHYHRQLLADLIRKLLNGRQVLYTNAPECVEITVFESRQKKQLILSLLNSAGDRPPVLHDISVRLPLSEDYRVKSAVEAPHGAPVEFSRNDDSVSVSIGTLNKFTMLILEYDL